MSKTVTILDIDNQIISVPINEVIKGSPVLKEFFDKNQDKAYKINQPAQIINSMLSVLKGEKADINNHVIELCRSLEVENINNYIDAESVETEVIKDNISHYLFNCLFLNDNTTYQSAKSSYITPKKTNMKPKPLIKFGHMTISQEGINVSGADTEKIIIRTFNVGQLVRDKIPHIKLDREIFDKVATMLVDLYSCNRNNSDYGKFPRDNYYGVLEASKNYVKYVIILKIVYVNEHKGKDDNVSYT